MRPRARASASGARMHEALITYFNGEKQAGLLLIGLGILGLAAAVIFVQPRWGLRSLGITLAVFALIEIAIGVGLYLRTGPQVSGLLAQLGSDTARFFSEEGARMARVQRNFLIVLYAEMAFILLAALVAFTQRGRIGLSGVALGVLINAGLLFAFDIVAERRGAAYLTTIDAARP